ncbi:DUF1850 domain-containing protein [Rhizobium sp. RU36D]|uniref:DUF1850 domain-containing protein n=1 Tax=Rhizobium sp. RU36D TaxID=1907415 RepID=UPI0009D79D38|nr:DUF1850 domain-containing protein [Rhizobium sp. RU36D]SMC43910.1 protein of unknown function [Rhizobium sp. RU36D]
MGICLFAGGKTLALATMSFTLSWTHSVEKVEWKETWRATPEGLLLERASVKGSGAGMEPGEGARLMDGWWIWTPGLAPQPRLTLAASGATVSPWTLCYGDDCVQIGAQSSAPAVIEQCPDPT